MLSSHSWWKWSLPTMSSTSGRARVSVSRNALDLRDPLVRERRPVGPRRRARAVVERVVRRGDDGDDGGHGSSCSHGSGQLVGVDVVGVAVDGEVDVHADRAAALLGELPEQAGRAGEQGEPAQQLDRQAQVGERGAAYPGAVERQPAAEHLLVDPADRLEQSQVRPAQPLLLGDPQQDRRPRVLDLVDRVAETGHEPPGLARPGHRGRGPARPTRRRRSAGRPRRRRARRPGTGRSPR